MPEFSVTAPAGHRYAITDAFTQAREERPNLGELVLIRTEYRDALGAQCRHDQAASITWVFRDEDAA